jgi:hypothetical protein
MNDHVQIGTVKDWHKPSNDDCSHNCDISYDCDCKRQVKRKPFRVVRVEDRNVAYNVNPKIVIEVWPNGTLTFREAKRRRKYHASTADIYSMLVRRQAIKDMNERKLSKKAALKARRMAAKARRAA